MTCFELWSIILNATLVLIGIVTIVVVILIYKRQANESLRLKYLPDFEPGKEGEYFKNDIRFPISFKNNNAYKVKISTATETIKYTLNEIKDSTMIKDKVYLLTVKINLVDNKSDVIYNFKITYSDIKKNKYRAYFTYKGIHLKSYYPDYPNIDNGTHIPQD